MFKTKRAPQDRIFDNRQVQIRDFYNQAIAKLVSSYALRYKHNELQQQIRVGNSIYDIDLDYYPQLKQQKIQQLMSTYNLNFSGLRSVTRRDGFGSEFLVVLPENPNDDLSKSKYIIDPLKYYYPAGKNSKHSSSPLFRATISLQNHIVANSIEDILNRPAF